MTRPERPSDFVRARITDARIERQWSALEQSGLPSSGALRSRSRARRVLAFALPVVLGLALGSALWLRAPAALPASALIESAAQPIAVSLEDGSRLWLSPRTRVQLVHNERASIELELRNGRARFEVTHDRARVFKVRAGIAEVRVVGTRFEIERKLQPAGTFVGVHVSEGAVEVRRRDADQGEPARTLRAGESFSVVSPAAASAPQSAASQAATPPAARDAALEGDDEVAKEDDAIEQAAAKESQARDASPARDAARIFRRASLARRAGRMRDAADGYAELLARFPQDGRAGVSAFELGRIRMDALGDPAAAIEALERALAGSGMASFHEDAMARIVVAYDALGRIDACRRARDRYLAGYPDGVHAHALAARCR